VENDSSDDTIARARAAGATVFSHPFVSIGAQRNAAIARANNEWILVVDADERGTASLGSELARVVGAPSADAYRVPRRNFFMGREIKHGGWERDRPVRLFRRTLRYDERPVHEHVIVDGSRVGSLGEPLLHTPYATLDEYFEKLDRYSGSWAKQHFERGRRAKPWMMVIKPRARFFTMYLLRGGWLDGTPGLVLAVLASMSVAAKYAKLWELGRLEAPGSRLE
jgi:glycosyltransferase involved in cell wall biosynthesis